MGFVFWILRRFCACIPSIANFYNSQKIVAPLTFGVGLIYLALSGWGIPAQRALIMGGLILLAILCNRSALSLRNLSIAATLILLWNPLAVGSISFQLSFAAVLSLIVLYEHQTSSDPKRKFTKSRWLRALHSILMSTTWATLATTPLIIDTFQRVSLHAFWTNLIAIPFTSFWIMPLGFLATVSTLWGGSSFLFKLWEWGLQGLVWIAVEASQMTCGIWVLPIPHPAWISVMTVGMLWFFLWRAFSIRWWGGVLTILGIGGLLIRSHLPDCYVFYTPSRPVVGVVQNSELWIYNRHKWANYATDQWALEQGLSIRLATHPIPKWIQDRLDPSFREGIRFGWKTDPNLLLCQRTHFFLPF
jgi:competence protein ComEC